MQVGLKMTDLKQGFPPLDEKTSSILILISLPGDESLKKNGYYANSKNSLWN